MLQVLEVCRNISSPVLKKTSAAGELNGKKITSYFNSTKNKQNHVPRELQDKITNALTEFIIIDSRPFEIVNGMGFINLIDVILSTGRTLLDLSTISASDLLVDPTTVSSEILFILIFPNIFI